MFLYAHWNKIYAAYCVIKRKWSVRTSFINLHIKNIVDTYFWPSSCALNCFYFRFFLRMFLKRMDSCLCTGLYRRSSVYIFWHFVRAQDCIEGAVFPWSTRVGRRVQMLLVTPPLSRTLEVCIAVYLYLKIIFNWKLDYYVLYCVNNSLIILLYCVNNHCICKLALWNKIIIIINTEGNSFSKSTRRSGERIFLVCIYIYLAVINVVYFCLAVG